MTDLEIKLIDHLREQGYPFTSFDGVIVKDMNRRELELFCHVLGNQCLSKEPIIEVSLKLKNENQNSR